MDFWFGPGFATATNRCAKNRNGTRQTGARSTNLALAHFQRQTGAPHALQVVKNLDFVDANALTETGPIVVPGRTFLSPLVSLSVLLNNCHAWVHGAQSRGSGATDPEFLASRQEATNLRPTMTDPNDSVQSDTSAHPDKIHRAMTDDGSFRVLTCDVTSTVVGAIEAQRATGAEAATFGELLVGTILFRETMSPSLRVQGIAKSANASGQFIADSHPSGDVRGLVQRKNADVPVTLQPGATLCMMRSMQNGSLNQGIVELGDKPTMSEGLMGYMQSSEQIVTMVGVGVTPDDAGKVERAGGYLVQLLPGAQRGPLMVMTERLSDFQDVNELLKKPEFTPEWLLGELLYGMPYAAVANSTVQFNCWCDELKVIGALSTLPRSDLEELASANEVLSINCDYCGALYEIPPGRLRGLLEES